MVHVVFLAKRSISPEESAVNLCLEDNGVNFTGTFKISWTVSMLLLGMSTFYLLKRINSENWSDYRISAFSGYFAIGYWIFLAYHVGVMLYSLERQPSFVFDLSILKIFKSLMSPINKIYKF